MSAAALGNGPGTGPGRNHDDLLPRPPGGTASGAALAVLVHAGLVAALTVSVDWRAKPPEVVSAELWASVPQIAAPAAEAPAPAPPPVPAPEPTPAPPPPAPAPTPAPPPPAAAPKPAEPDIATERAERRRAEEAQRKADIAAEKEREKARDKKERERKQAAEDDKKRLAAERRKADEEKKKRELAEAEAREAKAAEERLAKQREENLRRMMAEAGGTGPATSTGTAAQSAAPSLAYTGRLVALIRGNLVFTGTTPDNNAAEVEVSAAASGSIISRRLVKSSGHKEWDEAVLRAIDRTARLPRDADGRVPSRLIISFRPRE
jgi:colicin import membrane protein